MAQSALSLTDYPGVSIVALRAGDMAGPLARATLAAGDTMVLRGDATVVASLAADKHLAFRSEEDEGSATDALFNRTFGLAEVMIPPRSDFVGEAVFPGMVTPSGDLVILAVQRRGKDMGVEETILAAGDTVLLQGTWKALDEHLADPDVLVINSPEVVRRQAVAMGLGAKQAIGVLVAMVVLLATGLVPAVVAGLLAACAMVVLGLVGVEEAYRSINWTTVILVGAMTPLSIAMAQTGAAQMLADGLVRVVGDAGPYALLARPVRADGDHGPVDQQHGDGTDHHSHRGCGRGGPAYLGAAGADERDRGGGGGVPDAGGHAGEPDGDGAGRL